MTPFTRKLLLDLADRCRYSYFDAERQLHHAEDMVRRYTEKVERAKADMALATDDLARYNKQLEVT